MGPRGKETYPEKGVLCEAVIHPAMLLALAGLVGFALSGPSASATPDMGTCEAATGGSCFKALEWVIPPQDEVRWQVVDMLDNVCASGGYGDEMITIYVPSC